MKNLPTPLTSSEVSATSFRIRGEKIRGRVRGEKATWLLFTNEDDARAKYAGDDRDEGDRAGEGRAGEDGERLAPRDSSASFLLAVAVPSI